MRRAPAALLLAALAGCGGGGGERSPSEVARDYVAGDDPEKCDDADQRFLERQTRRKGDAAREACRRSVEESRPPREVSVRSESVDGDEAEVLLEAAGQSLRVTLRRTDDRWLVTGFG
jgi:hypothetical protein